MAVLLSGGLSTAPAAENAPPVHNADGSFVREWLVLGPFPSRDMETDFLARVGGEANVRPKEADSVMMSDGTRLTRTRLRSKSDTVNLEEVFGIRGWSVFRFMGRKIKSLLPLPPFSETVLSDTNGNFRFVNLRPGQYQLRGHGPDGFVAPVAGPATNATESVMVSIEPGQTRQGIEFRLPEIKKGVWKRMD